MGCIPHSPNSFQSGSLDKSKSKLGLNHTSPKGLVLLEIQFTSSLMPSLAHSLKLFPLPKHALPILEIESSGLIQYSCITSTFVQEIHMLMEVI